MWVLTWLPRAMGRGERSPEGACPLSFPLAFFGKWIERRRRSVSQKGMCFVPPFFESRCPVSLPLLICSTISFIIMDFSFFPLFTFLMREAGQAGGWLTATGPCSLAWKALGCAALGSAAVLKLPFFNETLILFGLWEVTDNNAPPKEGAGGLYRWERGRILQWHSSVRNEGRIKKNPRNWHWFLYLYYYDYFNVRLTLATRFEIVPPIKARGSAVDERCQSVPFWK